jgi:alpha-tubulin suppressor-like RCC1 family protein
MARGQGGTLSGFTPLSTPNAPTDLSVSTSIGSATVSFTSPDDTGDAPITAFVVTAIDESTGESTGVVGSSSPITVSPGGGTFKIRAQAVNGFGPGRLTEFVPGQSILSGAELYSWGFNGAGELGQNDVIRRSSPTQIGSLTTWEMVSAGGSTGGAVSTNGSLWVWGFNTQGTLGLGDTAFRSSPVQVGALTNWATVSLSAQQFCGAIKTDSTLWVWGDNGYGQLGDITIVDKSSPIQVGSLTNWAVFSAGGRFSAAIKTDGTLWAWGSSDQGQLGLNDVTRRSSPVQVGALSNWKTVVCSDAGSLAIKTAGSLWSWGNNSSGQLGLGDVLNRSSPVQIGGLTSWATASGVASHAAAVRLDGTLWAWGRNDEGQLGDGTILRRSSPVQVGALTNWLRVSAANGGSFTLAAKTEGTLWAWGRNNNGQLGDGTVVDRSSPVQIGALTDWYEVSAGGNHTLALLGVP